jgi:ABC-type spermidine/putrescine transport system permease subunit I
MAPIAALVVTSTVGGTGDEGGYEHVLQHPVYRSVMANTLSVSVTVACVCAALGLVLALSVSSLRNPWRTVALGALMVPALVHPLAIVCAWTLLLQRTGLANIVLLRLGLAASPLTLCYCRFAVVVVMTYMLFPFSALPCYAVLQSVGPRWSKVARNLGARWHQVLVSVTLPLVWPGVVGGFILVFLLALGFFVVPALLGGRGDVMAGNLVKQLMDELLDLRTGAALSILLIVATSALLVLAAFLVRGRNRIV